MHAWLNAPGNVKIPLDGVATIGRSIHSRVIVADEKVSRHHAVIHPQDDGEFWLIDLGSANGTYLNERRLMLPARLSENAELRFGTTIYTFQTSSGATTAMGIHLDFEKETVPQVNLRDCWLVLADIEGFSTLINQLESGELSHLVSHWLMSCKKIIDDHDGMVNKYTGDGFLAYWIDRDHSTSAKVGAAIKLLTQMQAESKIKFRLLVHWTPVTIGGASASGEECLLGRGVNYLFRAEKLAATIPSTRLFNDEAAARWPEQADLELLGEYTVKDFPELKRFYQLRATADSHVV